MLGVEAIGMEGSPCRQTLRSSWTRMEVPPHLHQRLVEKRAMLKPLRITARISPVQPTTSAPTSGNGITKYSTIDKITRIAMAVAAPRVTTTHLALRLGSSQRNKSHKCIWEVKAPPQRLRRMRRIIMTITATVAGTSTSVIACSIACSASETRIRARFRNWLTSRSWSKMAARDHRRIQATLVIISK